MPQTTSLNQIHSIAAGNGSGIKLKFDEVKTERQQVNLLEWLKRTEINETLLAGQRRSSFHSLSCSLHSTLNFISFLLSAAACLKWLKVIHCGMASAFLHSFFQFIFVDCRLFVSLHCFSIHFSFSVNFIDSRNEWKQLSEVKTKKVNGWMERNSASYNPLRFAMNDRIHSTIHFSLRAGNSLSAINLIFSRSRKLNEAEWNCLIYDCFHSSSFDSNIQFLSCFHQISFLNQQWNVLTERNET